MTQQDYASALQPFGYTQQEAKFVATVALHSGYFLRRQYNPKRGKAANDLCRKTVALRHASPTAWGTTSLYHLSAKPLYRALGQTDNRHRRDQDSFHLRAKVMGLDYVLLHPQFRYLPTEEDKINYFCGTLGIKEGVLPTKVYTGSNNAITQRYFVDKYPIRIDPQTKRVAFCYIDDGVYTPPGFNTWLKQYSPLLSALGCAEIVYVATSSSEFPVAQREFAKSFPSIDGILDAEVLAYFEQRRRIEERGAVGLTQAHLDTYRRLSRKYQEICFERQYALWRGIAGATAQPLEVGFSTFVLPFCYSFFSRVAKIKGGTLS